MLTDSEFTFELCQRAKKFNCFASKIRFVLQSGSPDFLLCDKETGLTIVFELKIRGDKMSRQQRIIAQAMGAAYNLVWVDGNNKIIHYMKFSENMKKLFEELQGLWS